MGGTTPIAYRASKLYLPATLLSHCTYYEKAHQGKPVTIL